MQALAIAAPMSGAGKTSVAIGLARVLARRGLPVQPFKVGPDFLDPTYLSRAASRPCYNLDPWMQGREYPATLFAEMMVEAEVALVEGVMGLFDGASAETSEGSTADLARLLGIPILLVVNTRGMARTLAAIVKGCCTLEPGLRIAGVIANHCGSERHRAWLADALASAELPPLLGAIPRDAFPPLPSRHLGLTTAEVETVPEAMLEQLADVVEAKIDLERLLALCESPRPARPDRPPTSGPRIRLGIARDSAFHFYYADNLRALERAGAELVPFSPLADAMLPPELDALYIGGGYPEEHAPALAANRSMREAVRAFGASGRVVYAECGGLMYLSEALHRGEAVHPMVGLLPFATRMCSRFSALGYAEVTQTSESCWGPAGTHLRGHVFHYSEIIEESGFDGFGERVYLLRRRREEKAAREGYRIGGVLASYVHLHWAGDPERAQRFVQACVSH